jgi:hypothetical protein
LWTFNYRGSSQQLMGRGRVEREREGVENGRNGNEVNKKKT